MRVRRAAVAPVVIVFAVLATACTTSYKTKATTKADFIAQADDICRTYDNRVTKATQNLKRPNVEKRTAMVEDRLVPLLERRNTELAHLTPPAADKATIAQFLADLNAETNAIGLDPGGFVGAHGTTPLAQKAAAEAAAYGFEVCART